jgi:hypothetical protein
MGMVRNLVVVSDEFNVVGICDRKTLISDTNQNNFYVLSYFWRASTLKGLNVKYFQLLLFHQEV